MSNEADFKPYITHSLPTTQPSDSIVQELFDSFIDDLELTLEKSHIAQK
jgi:hypothetical protein